MQDKLRCGDPARARLDSELFILAFNITERHSSGFTFAMDF